MDLISILNKIKTKTENDGWIINTDNYNSLLNEVIYSNEYIKEITEWLFLYQIEDNNEKLISCLNTVSKELLNKLNISGNRQDKRLDFCNILLFNMLRAYYRKTRVYIPSSNKYNNTFFFPFTHYISSSVINPLVYKKYLKEIKGCIINSKESYLSSYFPTIKLIKYLLKYEVFRDESLFDSFPKDAIYYNEKSKDNFDYETDNIKIPCDKQKLSDELEVLNNYNTLRYKSNITFNVNSDITINKHNFHTLFFNSLKIDNNGIITLRKNYATRIFNDKDYLTGGRFYRIIETRISEDIRKNLMINGSRVVELDYSGLHLRMLYHKDNIDFREDPYSGLKEELRPIYKMVALCSINAKNEKKAIQAIRNEIQKSINKGKFNMDMCDADGNKLLKNLTDETLRTLINNFKERHHLIKKYLFSDVGRKLQNKDSKITNEIIKHFTNKNILVLCVHDSYLIAKKHKKELYKKMIYFYQQSLGYKPIVKNK